MIYDYIIYSVNLSGIVAAIHFAKLGKKVLLLNHYGFMGGRITESLSLFQRIPKNLSGCKTKNIFESLTQNRDAFLFTNEENFILNPEIVKYTLQLFVEKYEIDLLFHITPIDFENRGDSILLVVSGKEGKIELRAKKILDASDNFAIAGLKTNSIKLERAGVNMITSVIEKDISDLNAMISTKHQLRDRRYFIRLKPLVDPSIYFYENEIQNNLNVFEKKLKQMNGRIQLIAPQADVVFNRELKNNFENILHINDVCSEFSIEEEFIKSSALELKLGELI